MAWFRANNDSDSLDALAVRAQAGDRRAFTRLYRGLHPTVARYVARRIHAAADAEDLTAKVFERLVAKLDTFDPARGCIEAWVVRIARNKVVDHLRARRPAVALDKAPELGDPRRDPATQLLAVEELSDLAARVRACDDEVRELLSLRFGDGLRHKAIAETLGISEAAVRKRLSRALKQLREGPTAQRSPSPTHEGQIIDAATGPEQTKEVGYVY